MKNIEIRGVLVDGSWDTPEMYPYIKRGLYSPSSYIIKQIKEADGEDIRLLVNSEGGDVFAYNDVINFLSAYTGKIEFEIGAICMSEAANLVLMSGKKTTCHRNSIMLFHSAMTTLENAAPGQLEDEAEMIRRINDPIKDALLSHGIPQSRIDRGFQDGRALILGAQELLEHGIVDYVIEDSADDPGKITKDIADGLLAIGDHGTRYAAFAENAIKYLDMKAEDLPKTDEEKKEEIPVDPEKQISDDPEAEPMIEETTEDQKEDQKEEITEDQNEEKEEDKEHVAEEDAAPDPLDLLTDKVSDHEARLADLESKIAELSAKLTEKIVETEGLKTALKAEKIKRIGSVAKVLNPAENTEPHDWREAVKRCNGDCKTAFEKYGHLARAWRESH